MEPNRFLLAYQVFKQEKEREFQIQQAGTNRFACLVNDYEPVWQPECPVYSKPVIQPNYSTTVYLPKPRPPDAPIPPISTCVISTPTLPQSDMVISTCTISTPLIISQPPSCVPITVYLPPPELKRDTETSISEIKYKTPKIMVSASTQTMSSPFENAYYFPELTKKTAVIENAELPP